MRRVQTEGVSLRPLIESDAEAYAAMRYHPEVAEWVLPADGDPVAAALASIERFQASWQERQYAPWGLFQDGRLIGHGGLNFVPEFGETEVLGALHPAAWKQGYATEMAHAALDYGFKELGLPLIFAITKPHNGPSQAVMRRLGLVYRKHGVYRGIGPLWLQTTREEGRSALE